MFGYHKMWNNCCCEVFFYHVGRIVARIPLWSILVWKFAYQYHFYGFQFARIEPFTSNLGQNVSEVSPLIFAPDETASSSIQAHNWWRVRMLTTTVHTNWNLETKACTLRLISSQTPFKLSWFKSVRENIVVGLPILLIKQHISRTWMHSVMKDYTELVDEIPKERSWRWRDDHHTSDSESWY